MSGKYPRFGPVTLTFLELKAFYEQSYTRGGERGELYAQWRALSAVGKADHVLALTPIALRSGDTRVLDVGCGDGALIAELARRQPGWRYAGVEIAEAAVDLAAGRCPDADVRAYDGDTLPFDDATFDLAVLSHVLEHVPDPVAALTEAARVAKRVIVEVPLEDNLSARRPSKRPVADHVGHIQRFSRAAIARLAGGAGLRVTGELADPLGRDVHTFFVTSPAGRARGTAKWLIRQGVSTLAPGTAERLFTVHYACMCEPAEARTSR
jgi:SAM-dependent methyltransferase